MNLTLHPNTQRFIEDQVKAGHFPTPEAVVEAAIASLQPPAPAELDAETLAAIDRSIDQVKRGEYRDWSEVSAELRRKYLTR